MCLIFIWSGELHYGQDRQILSGRARLHFIHVAHSYLLIALVMFPFLDSYMLKMQLKVFMLSHAAYFCDEKLINVLNRVFFCIYIENSCILGINHDY